MKALTDASSGTFLMEEADLECDLRMPVGGGNGGVGGRSKKSGGERLSGSDSNY